MAREFFVAEGPALFLAGFGQLLFVDAFASRETIINLSVALIVYFVLVFIRREMYDRRKIEIARSVGYDDLARELYFYDRDRIGPVRQPYRWALKSRSAKTKLAKLRAEYVIEAEIARVRKIQAQEDHIANWL